MSKKKFWQIRNSVDSSGSTLILEGPISEESWWGDEVTPQAFRDELKKISGDKLTVSINSVGGDVWAGVSIYNALAELDMDVLVKVDGLAASIASVIAMAGDKIIMSPGSTMMVHRASMLAMGDAEDMKKAIEMLESVEDGIVQIYAERTGQSEVEVREMMEAETWMSPEKAVELGFADEVGEIKKEGKKVSSIFSGNYAFSMSATKKSLDNYFTKVAKEEGDNVDNDTKTKEPATAKTTVSSEEPTKVIAKADKVEEPKEPETEEVVEPSVPEVNNSTKDKKMSKQEDIAKTQVIEPKAQATVEAKPTVKNYLKSKASMEAFARVLEEQAGKTSDDVRAAWKNHLEVKLGVTNPEIFLPEALITEIEDAFKEGGQIWNRVTKTGADVFRATWDIEDDVDSEDGRGRGYNRSDQADKAEQVLEFDERVLRPQFVYKYITLNKEDVKNQRSAGALVRYVLSELPRRVIREIERAIVIGDGRANGDDYKITSFVAIKADATADNVFAETYTPESGESRYSALLQAKDLIESDGALYLVAKKGYLTQLFLEQNVNGGFLFAPGTNLSSVLGFADVIEPDWMSADEDNDAYIVALSNYKTVGDNSIESFTNFILKQNKQEYLQEVWAGGGLTKRKSAVAIAVTPTS